MSRRPSPADKTFAIGLADPGLAFEEQWTLKLHRQEQHRRKRPVGDVAGALEE
jgi:hypothetical protein